MKLINKDDLLCDMKKCKAYGELSAKSAIRKVETWQTVDAIPVEWIKEFMEKKCWEDEKVVVKDMIEDWEKERC